MRYKKTAKILLVAVVVLTLVEYGLTILFIGYEGKPLSISDNVIVTFHEGGLWAGDDFEGRIFTVAPLTLVFWWIVGCGIPYFMAFVKDYDLSDRVRLFVVGFLAFYTVFRLVLCVNNLYQYVCLRGVIR